MNLYLSLTLHPALQGLSSLLFDLSAFCPAPPCLRHAGHTWASQMTPVQRLTRLSSDVLERPCQCIGRGLQHVVRDDVHVSHLTLVTTLSGGMTASLACSSSVRSRCTGRSVGSFGILWGVCCALLSASVLCRSVTPRCAFGSGAAVQIYCSQTQTISLDN